MTGPAAGGQPLPILVDTLSAEIVALYAAAEQQLLAKLADVARRGFTDTGLAAQARMLTEMRVTAQRVRTALRLRSGPLVDELIAEAAAHGDDAARDMLRAAVAGHPRLAQLYISRIGDVTGHAIAAANAIALELTNKLASVQTAIIRFADDAYRAAVADAATRLLLAREGLTPATAQDRAWNELMRLGVHGYTDSRGRRWNLATYVEMATRTAVQRAYNAAHQDRMTAVGIRYFTVPHDGHPCPLCRPFEGAILSSTHTGRVSARAADDGRPVSFRVDATVAEARAAGLFHPNCRHVLVPYLPGVTTATGVKAWTDADAERYANLQRLRELERKVRRAKLQELTALDDLAARRATDKIRRYQADIRQHVARSGLVRRPRRERIDFRATPNRAQLRNMLG